MSQASTLVKKDKIFLSSLSQVHQIIKGSHIYNSQSQTLIKEVSDFSNSISCFSSKKGSNLSFQHQMKILCILHDNKLF